MAWQVYGVLSNDDRAYGSVKNPIYGPLPRKRWVSVKGEKRHKVSYKAKLAYVGNSPDYDGRINRQAIAYAEWLARRDGKAIPDNSSPVICWQTMPSSHERNKAGRPVMRKLAMSVTWYAESRDRYRTTSRDPVLTISIPNWSWEPAPAIETIEPETLELRLAA